VKNVTLFISAFTKLALPLKVALSKRKRVACTVLR
jgi:hypothetical protein